MFVCFFFFSQLKSVIFFFFFFQAEDGIRDPLVTGVQTCALPISWLRQTTLTPAQHRASRSLAAASRLGEGESQVIAVTRPGQRCILDDKRAVRVARNRGIRPISTLLVPVIGWRRNLINADEAVRLVRLLGVASGALAETTLVLEEEITGGPQ